MVPSPLAQSDGLEQQASDSLSDAISARARLNNEVDDEFRQASDTWSQAEAALSKALRTAKQSARLEKRLEIDDGGLAPLRQSHSLAELDSTRKHLGKGGTSEIGRLARSGPLHFFGDGSDDERSQLRNQRIAAAREVAFEERAKMMRIKAADTAHQMVDHSRRRLKRKILMILKEVRRRQDLSESQARSRSFRDQRYKQGRAPLPDLGDASQFSLGLSLVADDSSDTFAQGSATPRRINLMESLSLDEIQMLRKGPRYFLEGIGPTDDAEELNAAECLIEFFTPTMQEKEMTIEVYHQKLVAQLAEQKGQDAQDRGEGLVGLPRTHSSGGISLGSRATSLQASSNNIRGAFLTEASVSSWQSATRSREPVRSDDASPTLLKVKEVYNRREENDALFLQEREQKMVERERRNAFKHQEAKKEHALEGVKQKELHKVRMLEAGERKAELEAEAAEELAAQTADRRRRHRSALDKADDAVEQKRGVAVASLEAWATGVHRADRNAKIKERKTISEHNAHEEIYMARLRAVGESRHNVGESQAQKNDKLKSRIQLSLAEQLKDQRRNESDLLLEAIMEKQEAARGRRQHNFSKYNFLDRSFGEGAGDFDSKDHSVSVDRRSESWRKGFKGSSP